MPRKAEGDRPLTAAERQSRQRERKALKEQALIAAIQRIQAAKTISEAREIAAAVMARV